jgi:hypothetical protein
MTKRGDGPTTRRMGFGYEQARAAGAPFRNERAASTLSAERIEREVQSLTLNYALYGIKAHHPDPKGYALRCARGGLSAERIVALLREQTEEAKAAKQEAESMRRFREMQRLIEREDN